MACLTLKEVRSSLSHSRVNIGFGGLNVVVEVVPESLDVRDDIRHALRGQMAREKD